MSTTPSAKNQHLELSEASSDLRHVTAKSVSKPNHRILKSLLEGKSSMDAAYKTVFINLLTSDEEADPREVVTESEDGIEQMERLLQAKESGIKCRIMGQKDEDGSRKVKTESDEGIELMERPSQAKKSGKECRMVDHFDKDDSHKVRTDNVELMERPSQVKNRKRKCRIVDQHDEDDSSEEETESDETDSDKTESDEIESDETESDDSESYESESDDIVELVERTWQVKNRKRKCSLKDQRGGHRGRARISKKSKVPSANDGLHPTRTPCDHAARVKPVQRCKGKLHGKGKGVVRQEHEADEKKPDVKKETEMMQERKSWIRRMRELARAHSRKKTAVGTIKKEGPDHHVETRPPRKGIHKQVRKVKCAKCSHVYSSDEGYWEEGEGSSKTVPEVVILDSDKVLKKEIRSPFVSTKERHLSMDDDEFDFDDKSHEQIIDSDFRKELLEVLRKPFDKAELRRLRETFKLGLYACYHPGVQRRLTIYRYRRENCLSILRGFMFWLKNVSREGVFQPWKHKRYIELELPSH